jgi:protein-disulfide isomerase
MSKKFWIVFIAIVVGVFAFAFSQSSKESSTSRKVENPKVVQADDHIRGKADSKVYMITYGDFECPACNAWEPEVQKITEEYKDEVAFIFRHFPLTDKHINAFAAARASEAAAKQGKFWEMHDLLYEKWSQWQGNNKSAQTTFEGYAEELSLDLNKFKEDYQSSEVADRINSDLASAKVIGATGTPTFAVNGEIIDVGSVSEGAQTLRNAIEAKLNN